MTLRLYNVSKSYRDADRELTVISDLSWEFIRGGSTAVIGKSGVGKSTLLHLLAGLDSPSSGSISYDETDIATLSADQRAEFRREHLGFVFQFHHLLPEFSAL